VGQGGGEKKLQHCPCSGVLVANTPSVQKKTYKLAHWQFSQILYTLENIKGRWGSCLDFGRGTCASGSILKKVPKHNSWGGELGGREREVQAPRQSRRLVGVSGKAGMMG